MPSTCRTQSIVALLCLAATSASAQLVPIGPEQLLSSDLRQCALLAGTAGGSYAVGWEEHTPPSGFGSRLHVQVVDEADVPLPARQLRQLSVETVVLDALQATGSGYAMQWSEWFLGRGVFWDQKLDATGGPSRPAGAHVTYPIRSHRPAGGYVQTQRVRCGLEVRVFDDRNRLIGRPAYVGDRDLAWWTVSHRPDGHFVVLYGSGWLGLNRGYERGIRAVWLSGRGKVTAKAILVVPPGAVLLGSVVAPDGTLTVSHSAPDPASTSPILRSFNGPRRGSAGLSRVLAEVPRSGHALAAGSNGDVLLVWTEDSAAGSRVIAQLFSPALEPLGAPSELSGPTAGVAHECPLAATAGTDWVVSWTNRTTPLGEIPRDRELYARRFASP